MKKIQILVFEFFLLACLLVDLTISVPRKARPGTPPEFTQIPRYFFLEEEIPIGTEIFEVKARDYDLNWDIHYSIKDPFNLFTIDPRRGTVTVAKRIDAEDPELFFAGLVVGVTITATEVFDPEEYPDLTPEQTQTSVQLDIYVGDINDHIPELCNYNVTVPCSDVEVYRFNISSNYVGLIDLNPPLLAKDLDSSVNNCIFKAAFGPNTPELIKSTFNLSPTQGIRQQEFHIYKNARENLEAFRGPGVTLDILITAKDYPNLKATALISGVIM